MTRAAERLIVCGTQGDKKIPDGCWYQLVRDALRSQQRSGTPDDGGDKVLRYRKAPDAGAKQSRFTASASASVTTALPDWLTRPASPINAGERIIRPPRPATMKRPVRRRAALGPRRCCAAR